MTDTPTPPPADTRPSLGLRAQYIKDMSFENPRAPANLFSLTEPPQMDVSINLGAQRLEETIFEVVLQISVRAVGEKTTLFLCDLVYAGIIEAKNIPDDQLEVAVYVQGAQLIFPFARRVVADVTRDGGFPGLQLDPVDFYGMYVQQRARAEAAPAT